MRSMSKQTTLNVIDELMNIPEFNNPCRRGQKRGLVRAQSSVKFIIKNVCDCFSTPITRKPNFGVILYRQLSYLILCIRLSEESHNDKILRVIDEMGLKPSEVELLEDCEMVTNLIIGQVLEMMENHEMRKDVLWLQEQHIKPNRKRWTNIIELTAGLWEKAGGGDRVKKYHSIEASCREVSNEDIQSIADPLVRETVMKIRHIHDSPLERINRIASKCYYE